MALLFLLIPMSLLFSSLQGSAIAGIQVQTPYAVVKTGDPIVMLCKGDGPLKYCRMSVPGESNVIVVSESLNRPNLKYEGAGLESGQCGIKIDHAEVRHNGVFQCSFPVDPNTEASGNMTVVIAQPPTPPEMIVGTPGSQGIDSYKEGDLFSAKCVVRNGRPVTNFTWYLGDVLLNEGLSTPVVTPSRNDLYTTEQNITRSLQAYDNGKEIRCIADHPGLNEGTKSTKRLIKVEYGPKPAVKKFEHFGLVEGSEGRISVIVEANPRPNFIWKIGKISIVEEQTEDRFYVEKAVKQGLGSWESVLVINSLTKEDVDQEYTVKATNSLGERTYSVEISTSPEPKVLSIGTGTIIVIIFILVLVFILIGGVLFARAKGRWCFAGTLTVAPRLAGESSDTESADHTTSELKPKRTFISVFKKSSDKVATIPEEAPPKMDTDDKPSEESDRLKEKEDTDGNATADDNGEGVVYAELDIQARRNDEGPAIVRGDDDKTEYAEIIHVKNHPKQ